MNSMPTIISLAVAITTLGGAWLTIRRIARDAEKSKKQHAAAILQSAKEADQSIKLRLESKIHDLEKQMDALKIGIEKDMSHLRETYNGEIKFLGQKIEALREEVRNQHGQLVTLLTKMIENKD